MAQRNLLNTNMSDLDPKIWSLAKQADLGELRNVYHASKRYTAHHIMGGIILMWGVFFMIASILAILFSPTHPSPAWALAGLIPLVAGCYMILPQKMYAHWHVYLCESGFLYEKAPLYQVFRWDQIESIQGNAGYVPQRGYVVFTYKVRHLEGYEVKLNNVFLDGAELVTTVMEEFLRQVAARELPIVPRRNRTFADFKLDRQSISDKEGALTWQEIQEVTIENGRVSILKKE